MRLLEAYVDVEDVERSLDLYKRLLPHRHVLRWADNNVAALVFADGSALGIWKKETKGIHGGWGGAHLHFAFQIAAEEYDGCVLRIRHADLEPLEHVWNTGDKSVYFFDFDGNQGEFMTADWLTLNGFPRL